MEQAYAVFKNEIDILLKTLDTVDEITPKMMEHILEGKKRELNVELLNLQGMFEEETIEVAKGCCIHIDDFDTTLFEKEIFISCLFDDPTVMKFNARDEKESFEITFEFNPEETMISCPNGVVSIKNPSPLEQMKHVFIAELTLKYHWDKFIYTEFDFKAVVENLTELKEKIDYLNEKIAELEKE